MKRTAAVKLALLHLFDAEGLAMPEELRAPYIHDGGAT